MKQHLCCSIIFMMGILSMTGSMCAAMSLDELLAAHESTVGLIRDIDITVDVYTKSFNGKKYNPPLLNATWRWSREARRERHRFCRMDLPREEGTERRAGTMMQDLLEDGEEWRVLTNWNPEHPPKLHPRDQANVRARIVPRYSSMIFAVDAQFAMTKIALESNDPRRTLSAFVAASGSSRVEERSQPDGTTLFAIVVTDPPCSTKPLFDSSVATVFIDPSINYMVRRLEWSWTVKSQPASGRITRITEAKSFKDFGDGIYLPMEVESRMLAPALLSGPSVEDRMVARDVIVNASLPPDAMGFRFPENALVTKASAGQSKEQLFLWGPDDRPAKEVFSAEDLGPPIGHTGRQIPRGWILLYSLLGVVILATLLFFVRSRARGERA